MTDVDATAAALLARIESFGFSEPADPLGFESRLADDQGWTLGYALAVAEEYRRFLVLTQVAGQPVSPSPDVDEAWHLHLTRTAHYEAFCTASFGRFLHHEPARAGEGKRHRLMYRDTLAAYLHAFGARAPTTIWPGPGSHEKPQPAAPATWTVPAELRPGHRLAIVAVLCAIALGLLLRNLGLLAPLQAVPPFTFLGVALLVPAALGWLGLRGGAAPLRAMRRDMLEPYEAAWLAGGVERMAMTAIVLLTERGILLPPGRPSQRGERPPIPVNATIEVRCVHPAEVACLSAAAGGGLRFAAACLAMRPYAGQVEQRLVRAGIARDAGVLPLRRAGALLALVAWLAVEFERIFHAFGTSHRIGFLVMLTLAGVVLAFVLAWRSRRSGPRAERVLRPLRLAAGRYRKAPPAGQALAFGVALIGGTVLADDLRFDGLKQQVDAGTPASRGAGNGSGGSDGSSCSSCGSDGGSGGGGGSSCGSSCGSGCGGGGGD
jgi:uncharacterized protein (TIGR04222 family)